MLWTQEKFFLIQLQKPLSWVEFLNKLIIYLLLSWIFNRVYTKKKKLFSVQLQEQISWVELLNKKITIKWEINGWMIAWLWTLKKV